MIVKITSKRQVTFPARVLEALGVQPGDQLELREGPDGFTLHPRRVDLSKLAPLRDKIDPDHEISRSSAVSPMMSYGIDTSVLVRLLTGSTCTARRRRW